MKEYINTPEEGESTVNEPAVAYEVVQPRQDFFAPFDVDEWLAAIKDDFEDEEIAQPIESYFAPIDADDMNDEIPLDAEGNPIGTPWEEVIERMYDNLSKHYGVDLRTL
jgi:hypothetical protein